MSFFIKNKGNRKQNEKPRAKKRKLQKTSTEKQKLRVPSSKQDEITSSSEDEPFPSTLDEIFESEDDNETAQEKKLRLAKVYLKEIEAQGKNIPKLKSKQSKTVVNTEKKKLAEEDDEQSDQDEVDNIRQRLKNDHLKQTGRFRTTIADSIKSYGKVTVLKGKEHKNAVTCICITEDDKHVFSGSKDGGIIKWSLESCTKMISIPYTRKTSENATKQGHSSPILAIAVSFDGRFLAVGDASPNIQIWNAQTMQHMKTLTGHKNSVYGLVFRRSTCTLYSASADRSVKVWSLDEMSYVESLYGHLDAVTSIDALYRERAITAGGRDASIRLWKIAEESQLIYNGDVGSTDVVRLLNEDTFVSCGDSGHILLWGTNKKKALVSIPEAHGCDQTNNEPLWVTALAALVNADLVASGSSDGNIKLWAVGDKSKSLRQLLSVPVHGYVNSLAFTKNGSHLIAAVGNEHRLGRWNVIKTAKNCVLVIELLRTTN